MPTASPKFSLDLQDALKGLLMAVLVPVLDTLTNLSNSNFHIDWTSLWHLSVSAGAAYLIKNYFSGPPDGTPPSGINNALKKTLTVLVFLVLCGITARSQSIFKALPLTPAKKAVYSKALLLPTDSTPNITNGTFHGLRFAGPDLSFAIPDFSIYTGLGIDWVSATADPATGKWAYNFTIGPRVYGGANLGVPSVQAIGAVGVRASFFKGFLAVGVLYNLTTKKPQATMGNPAALIPGLN